MESILETKASTILQFIRGLRGDLYVTLELREITDEQVPNDPAEWRNWYLAHGSERAEKFSHAGLQVLGSS